MMICTVAAAIGAKMHWLHTYFIWPKHRHLLQFRNVLLEYPINNHRCLGNWALAIVFIALYEIFFVPSFSLIIQIRDLAFSVSHFGVMWRKCDNMPISMKVCEWGRKISKKQKFSKEVHFCHYASEQHFKRLLSCRKNFAAISWALFLLYHDWLGWVVWPIMNKIIWGL